MSEAGHPIRVLMVDVDGVLVHGRPADGRPVFSELRRDLGLGYEQLRARFFNRYWEDIVSGREAMLPRLGEVLTDIAPQLSAEELVRYWLENDARTAADDLEALDDARSSGLRVYLATNQEHLRAADLMERVGLARHVDGMIYSARLGTRKPEAAFFRLATEEAGVAPAEIGFIDDVADNVLAARRGGWRAVQFDGSETLRETLAGLVA